MTSPRAPGAARRAAAAAALLLVLVACGRDEAAPSERPDGPTTTAPTTGTPPAEDDATGAARTPLPGFGEVEVRVVRGADGEPVVLCVLLAETPEQRQRGLMEVTDLGGYAGMLFTYPDDQEGGFWMRDTVLPLSIAYLDADGRVVSTADMDPCPDEAADCPSHPAAGPFRRALEVPRGGLDDLGLVEGSSTRLEVGGACAPAPS